MHIEIYDELLSSRGLFQPLQIFSPDSAYFLFEIIP